MTHLSRRRNASEPVCIRTEDRGPPGPCRRPAAAPGSHVTGSCMGTGGRGVRGARETGDNGGEGMAETATAEGPAGLAGEGERSVAVVFSGLLLVMLLASLDSTIVATALPTIVGEMGGIGHLSWVVTAYLLAQTVVTPLYGKLGDLYGRKSVLQSAVVIFLVGSALCGLSRSLTALIAFRAIQGLGGGGLAVSAQAAIGDVIPPRDRGRYQGIFGAVFGLSSVAGPLIGGFFTTNFTWRWIFYINLPIGILAMVVLGATLPSATERKRHRIDYAGAGLLAVGLAALILLTDLGGSAFPWASVPIALLGAGSVLALVSFVAVERRAGEPVLPPRLFRNPIFTLSGAVGLVVGFAMFGSITYLPLFLQTVKGSSPTSSGLQLLPVMGGMLVTSIASGQLISRWGRYKVFPVVGTAVMTVGLFLLSRLGAGTSLLTASAYMLVLGMGLGLVMQVLVLAVQNSVDYTDLGVATSGATLFRSIGGSLGTAVLGAIFAGQLSGHLARLLPAGSHAAAAGAGADPASLARLSAPVRELYVRAFTESLDHVFLVAAVVGAVAFVLTWFLQERPLRASVAAAPAGVGQAFAMPTDEESWTQLSRMVWGVLHRQAKVRVIDTLAARAGVDLPPAACWLLVRIALGHDADPVRVGHAYHLPPDVLRDALSTLSARGLVTRDGGPPDAPARATPQGMETFDRLREAGREWLCEMLEAWQPEDHADLTAILERVSEEVVEGRGG
jgi:EmrB/QacA subfamily drug resistance transporter